MDTTTTHPTALITGANKGLGRETTRRLATLGWRVWLSARDEVSGTTAAEEIRHDVPGADIRFVRLDVTDDASVGAAYDVVEQAGTGLDALVNNAGVIGTGAAVLDTAPADFLPAYGVNVLGPVRVTRAFLPLLRRSAQPRLVMVSSGMGSVARTTDPDRPESTIASLVYPSSKAAVTMLAVQYAKALPDVRVSAVDPGYTATDLNAHRGPQTVSEGTDAIVAAVTADDVPAPFFDRFGPVAS
jgi:NAD(P)-dependent dehydrogenase (short-subunit alcohol dehydrogenase family)